MTPAAERRGDSHSLARPVHSGTLPPTPQGCNALSGRPNIMRRVPERPSWLSLDLHLFASLPQQYLCRKKLRRCFAPSTFCILRISARSARTKCGISYFRFNQQCIAWGMSLDGKGLHNRCFFAVHYFLSFFSLVMILALERLYERDGYEWLMFLEMR